MKINALPFLLLMICTMSCNCGDMKPYVPKKSSYKLTVVLCDLTTSISENSIDTIANRAARILKVADAPSTICFTSIDSDQFAPPISRFELKTPAKPTDRKIIKEALEEEIEALPQKIRDKYKQIKLNLDGDDPARSCILSSIKGADQIFRSLDKDTSKSYTYSLVILSDMIMECNDSELGKVRFTPNGYENAKRKVKAYTPEFDLSYVDNLYVIPYSNEEYSKSKLSSAEIQALWVDLFEKLKYPNSREIHFVAMIPPKL